MQMLQKLFLQTKPGSEKNYSTIDHILTLHMLIELYKSTKRPLYCAFIDFEAAFDKVWRLGLWNKLVNSNINGKCFKVIRNMYDGIKARVKMCGSVSNTFPCEVGVRQGENLSPFLFSIFLNDLQDFLRTSGCNGLPYTFLCITETLEKELNLYLNIFVLLYADDTILLSETPFNLQCQLNHFADYCEKWKLKVNIGKTKIMIFAKGQHLKSVLPKFRYMGNLIEIVQYFKYLGVYFSSNGSFVYNIKQQYDKATKAMYGVLSSNYHNLSIESKLDLFDKILQPILLYGCEVWGYSNLLLIEKFHLRFCKYILNVNNKTPNCMIYGELGRYPLDINIKTRMIASWVKCVTSNNKIVSHLYRIMHNCNNFKWNTRVKHILDECGLSYIWGNYDHLDLRSLETLVKQNLKDQFMQNWHATINDSSKCLNYRIYKDKFEFDKYIDILPYKWSTLLCKFRTCNFKLPVETGRWQNIARQERRCTLCSSSDIGDEFHYLFLCSDNDIVTARSKFISSYYYKYPNVIKFNQLLNCKNTRVLVNLCKFLKVIKERVSPPG